jgi:acetyl-CoA carboxylase, biotin carboxylase subunit
MPTRTCASGRRPSSESYLNIPHHRRRRDHRRRRSTPGYGFLAENAHFAEVLGECNLTWIGPRARDHPPDGRQGQGARDGPPRGRAGAAGQPRAARRARKRPSRLATEVGYPVILKAAAGGGGRGMRIVHSDADSSGQFSTAREEAERAFGDGSIYLEKYLLEPRHIEFQVFGDQHGNVIHLGERECSIQRRHQKLIEEAPSPALTPELRERDGRGRGALCEAVGYENAGTIEFLLDSDGSFYFMEMNTRIQVEHPVTEMVTGVDLVRLQIRVAAGEPLTVPSGLKHRGHAIECRINAEDPETFAPSPGRAHDLPRAGRARRPGRHPRLRGLRRPAPLRLAGRQGDRPRPRSRGGDRCG